jgi:cobalt/nickel transport system ATP-binding protein
MSLIDLQQVSFSYPARPKALDNVSLSISPGERVALMGPNGAGKSTLFQLINGLLKPAEGQVSVAGMPVTDKNLNEIRRRVGMVFQDADDQLFNATVYREVAYGPVNMRLPQHEREERVRWALEVVGMTGFADKTPFNLSGGEKKRVALASVLAMQPEILLLDEPTNALDPKGASQLVSLLNRINRDTGITLLFSTHDVDIVPLLADRVVLMHQGRICASGTPTEVFRQKELLRAMDLRLPRIAHLAEILMRDGMLPPGDLPLSIGQARAMLSAVLSRTEEKV